MENSHYTLAILSERVIFNLSGGKIPHDTPYDPAYVDLTVIDAINQFYSTSIKTVRRGVESDRSTPGQINFTYSNLVVKKEEITDRLYIEMPAPVMDLPHNSGIKRLAGNSFNDDFYPYINNITVHLNLSINYQKGCYQEGSKLFILKSKQKEGDKMSLTMSTGISPAIGRDEKLPIAPGDVFSIIEMAKEATLKRVLSDQIKNDNPEVDA